MLNRSYHLTFKADLECGPLLRVPLQESQDELDAPLAHVLGEGPHSDCQDVGDCASEVVGVLWVFEGVFPCQVGDVAWMGASQGVVSGV